MYRVGYQCFATSEAAHDYLLSQQLPMIMQDGKIIRPVKQGHNWYLHGQQIQLSFPKCDIASQIADGGLAAVPFIFLTIMVWGFKQAQGLIENISKVGINDD